MVTRSDDSLWLEISDEGRSLQFAGSSQQWQRPVDHLPGTAWARTPVAIYGGALAYGCGEWLVFGCPEAGKGAGWCWSPACFSWSCAGGYIFLVNLTKIVVSYRFWFDLSRKSKAWGSNYIDRSVINLVEIVKC
jgi:hypothetical protein